MTKLFVFQKKANAAYSRELACGFKKSRESSRKRELGDLSLSYLRDNAIDVVISNGLPNEWYYILKGMHIVTITIDSLDIYHDLADIVIDYKSENSNRYFTGKSCSLCNNSEIAFEQIANLITLIKWDSGFWGFPVAYLSCRHLTENIVFRIEKFIKRNNIRLIEYLCNCHDKRSVSIAEKNGFHFTDIRLSFEKNLKDIQECALADSISFGKARKKDIESLQALSKDLYRNSRYYFDDNFDREKVDEFYQSWVAKAVLGKFDDECYSLYDNTLPIGLCTIRYHGTGLASIGLFGLSHKHQGRGLGKLLLQTTLSQLATQGVEMVNVVTQGRNYFAQRLYQSTGFMTKSTELWYHKWL